MAGIRWETGGQAVFLRLGEAGRGTECGGGCVKWVCLSWRCCGQIRWTAGLHPLVPADSHHRRNIARWCLWRLWQSALPIHIICCLIRRGDNHDGVWFLKWGELTSPMQEQLWRCMGMIAIISGQCTLVLHSMEGKLRMGPKITWLLAPIEDKNLAPTDKAGSIVFIIFNKSNKRPKSTLN